MYTLIMYKLKIIIYVNYIYITLGLVPLNKFEFTDLKLSKTTIQFLFRSFEKLGILNYKNNKKNIKN